MRLTGVFHKSFLPAPLQKYWSVVERRIDAYNLYLKNNYPKLYELQKGLVNGTKKTFIEGKDFTVVKYDERFRSKPLDSFTYKQMMLRFQYPKDLWKLGPVLVIMALPFSTFLLLPVIYLFPKLFLTRHFWTEDQKHEFAKRDISRRLRAVPVVINFFGQKIPHVRLEQDREQLRYLLNQAQFARQIHEKEILDAQKIFQQDLFMLGNLNGDYRQMLAELNGTWMGYLEALSFRLGELDKYLDSHPDIKLDNQDVREAVLLRGLDPSGDQENLRDFLDVWASTSARLTEPADTLRLHLPLFLSSSHPVNRECHARNQMLR